MIQTTSKEEKLTIIFTRTEKPGINVNRFLKKRFQHISVLLQIVAEKFWWKSKIIKYSKMADQIVKSLHIFCEISKLCSDLKTKSTFVMSMSVWLQKIYFLWVSMSTFGLKKKNYFRSKSKLQYRYILPTDFNEISHLMLLERLLTFYGKNITSNDTNYVIWGIVDDLTRNAKTSVNNYW